MTIDQVVSRLAKVRKSGMGFTALCPAHDDKSPSLSISEGEGRRTLLKCFAGCSTEAILNAIGLELKDLYADGEACLVSPATDYPRDVRLNGNGTAPAKFQSAAFKKRIDTVYSYTDAGGRILYENVRFRPKAFTQRRPDGKGGYIYNLEGIDRVPYRLPELLAACDVFLTGQFELFAVVGSLRNQLGLLSDI